MNDCDHFMAHASLDLHVAQVAVSVAVAAAHGAAVVRIGRRAGSDAEAQVILLIAETVV